MINNPIINRIAVVVLLACVYAAGYDTAKQQAAQADRQGCHLPAIAGDRIVLDAAHLMPEEQVDRSQGNCRRELDALVE